MEHDTKVTGLDRIMNETIQNILERRSIRHFLNKKISQEELELIAHCGINAPNGQNRQTWKITVLCRENDIEILKNTMSDVLDRTKTDSMHGFDNPVAVMIVTDRKTEYNAMVNGACVLSNIFLSAWSMGIGTCWVNALRTIQEEPGIRSLLTSYSIPDTHIVIGMAILGYLPDELPKKPKRRESVIHFVD